MEIIYNSNISFDDFEELVIFIKNYFFQTIPFLDKELIYLYKNDYLRSEIQDYFYVLMKTFNRIICMRKIYMKKIRIV